jgi:hypothetical protein
MPLVFFTSLPPTVFFFQIVLRAHGEKLLSLDVYPLRRDDNVVLKLVLIHICFPQDMLENHAISVFEVFQPLLELISHNDQFFLGFCL